MSGGIPAGFANMNNLVSLDMTNTSLSGPVPSGIGSASVTRKFAANHNLVLLPFLTSSSQPQSKYTLD